MSKTTSDATSSHLSSSDDDSSPITHSQKGLATTSKPTAIKKAVAVEADPESESSDSEAETVVAPKKAKSMKKKSSHTKKAAAVVEVEPEEAETLVAPKKAKSRKEKISSTVKGAVVPKPSIPAKRVASVSPDEPSPKRGSNSGMFQRLWTEEDEFTVLNEMVDYMAEKGVHALSDSKGFHAFVNHKLIGDFDRSQVSGKVRKLKKKCKTLSKKKTLTPHEKKLVKLSKLIWGPISDTNSMKKAAAEEEDAKEEDDAAEYDAAEEEDAAMDDDAAEDVVAAEDDDACKKKKVWKFIGKKSIAMGLDAEAVKAGLEGCSYDVKVGIEEEWEQYHLEEAALFQKQLNLVLRESNCVLEGLNRF